jgi:hypothetical protein
MIDRTAVDGRPGAARRSEMATLTDDLLSVEMDGSRAADARRIVRDERMAVMARGDALRRAEATLRQAEDRLQRYPRSGQAHEYRAQVESARAQVESAREALHTAEAEALRVLRMWTQESGRIG